MLDILPAWQWYCLWGSAILIGMSKTGIQGLTTLVIPVLALVFGSRESTGLILPILCMADLIAIVYYRRTVEWKYIGKLLPAAVAGFGVALLVDQFIPVRLFRYLLAFSILIGLAFLFRKKSADPGKKPGWYAPLFGLLGGFTTMIGNAAGPIMSVYLLSVGLPKYAFVGTSAWFFMIVNYLKLPLQAFVWKNITVESLTLGLTTLPFLMVGAIMGIWFVRILPEKSYRLFIIAATLVSTLMLLF